MAGLRRNERDLDWHLHVAATVQVLSSRVDSFSPLWSIYSFLPLELRPKNGLRQPPGWSLDCISIEYRSIDYTIDPPVSISPYPTERPNNQSAHSIPTYDHTVLLGGNDSNMNANAEMILPRAVRCVFDCCMSLADWLTMDVGVFLIVNWLSWFNWIEWTRIPREMITPAGLCRNRKE